MTENIKDIALSYFKTFSEKNINGLREMFEDNVTLRDWDIDKKGIESVLKANLNIFQNVKTINAIPQNIISENNFVFAELKIVVNDEKEHGDRALLNLGHTFCHALETATGYSDRMLHGEGVAIGCILAFDLSAKMGLTSQEDPVRIKQHFSEMGMMNLSLIHI